MIINSVRAENVLKYSILELKDIPEKGLIAITGDNESGKSSIGECICFALFGRTFSLEPTDLDKVIRWGESRCSTKLELSTPSGQHYQVARFLDELGNHGASISRTGEQPMVRGVKEVEASLKDIIGFGYTEFIESFYLAQREITTPHPHSYAVKAMAGVDALEKIVSNCREEKIHSETQIEKTEQQEADVLDQIDSLCLREGHLESLKAERQTEDSALHEARAQISALKTRCDENERILGELRSGASAWLTVSPDAAFNERLKQAAGLDLLVSDTEQGCSSDSHTYDLWRELRTLAADTRERLSAFDALGQKADAYRSRLVGRLSQREAAHLYAEGEGGEQTFSARQEVLRQREKHTAAGKRFASALMFVFLFLAIAGAGLWGLLVLAPDAPQATPLRDWLSGINQDWKALFLPWLPVLISVLTVLFLAFMARGITQSSRLGSLRQARKRLSDEEEVTRKDTEDLARLDDMPLPDAVEFLTILTEESIASQALSFAEVGGAPLIDPQAHADFRGRFSQTVEGLQTGISRVSSAAGEEIELIHGSVERHASRIARLGEAIDHEQERVRKHRKLTGISQDLRAKIDGILHRIRVRNLAIDVLNGAIHYISQRFNTEVRNLSADSLPKFTNGRYEHLQIDENLKVKAFSNEKRDFMDLDEISSGTQRQIMLAVRVALSQKLVNSVIQGPQTLFLDEPFVFFDERRTANSLAVLPQVSADFTQIWVTSQTFPTGSHFDLYIECNAEEARSPVVRRGLQGDSS